MDDNTLNDFLITQRWRRFSWNDVMSEKKFDRHPSFSFVRLAGKAIHPEGKLIRRFDTGSLSFCIRMQTHINHTLIRLVILIFHWQKTSESTEVYYRVETKVSVRKEF